MSKILVVDDDPGILDLLREAIEPLGHEISFATDGLEAVTKAEKENPDLILLDLELPGLDGFEVCTRLKSVPGLKDVPIIFLSMRGEVESKIRALNLGAIDYVSKPFSMIELIARVQAHLATKISKDETMREVRDLGMKIGQSETLISSLFPESVVPELKQHQKIKPRRYENVAILIADIVGFTRYCEDHDPEEVMSNIQELGDRFDRIAKTHGLEKINFIGDSFMAAAGMFSSDPHPVLSAVKCGFELGHAAETVPAKWRVRVGVDFGPVISGIAGAERSLLGLFGDTVNTAARMQTLAKPGKICVSAKTWAEISPFCNGVSIGKFKIKGKGEMEIFHVDGLF